MTLPKLKYFSSSETQPIWEESFVKEVQVLLNKKYAIYLEEEEFLIEASFNVDVIQLKLTLAKANNEWVYPIECVYIKEVNDKINPEDLANNMLDYLSFYWDEYFQDGRDTFFPIDWSRHEFEDKIFYIRGFIRNLKLESEADKILSEHGSLELISDKIDS